MGIVRARRLSAATMRNIRQNLFFAFVYNAAGVPIAAGVLYPVVRRAAVAGDRRRGDGALVGERGRQRAAAAQDRDLKLLLDGGAAAPVRRRQAVLARAHVVDHRKLFDARSGIRRDRRPCRRGFRRRPARPSRSARASAARARPAVARLQDLLAGVVLVLAGIGEQHHVDTARGRAGRDAKAGSPRAASRDRTLR